MGGSDLVFDGKAEGKYHITDFSGWRYKSSKPQKKQRINLWFHNSHCGSGELWMGELDEMINEDMPVKKAWEENMLMWKAFWDNS